MQLKIVDMTGPTDLPCYEVWVDHPDGPTLTEGSGCHPDRSVALVRALTEAAQSRLTYIAGARDDIPRHVYRPPTSGSGRRTFRPTIAGAKRSFLATPSALVGTFRAQIADIVGRVRTLTGMSPIAVDLARPDTGLSVLFVIAPGLKTRPII
jgi:ribosomal protein S12 methylthiotransferase accessory factor